MNEGSVFSFVADEAAVDQGHDVDRIRGAGDPVHRDLDASSDQVGDTELGAAEQTEAAGAPRDGLPEVSPSQPLKGQIGPLAGE